MNQNFKINKKIKNTKKMI